MKARARKRRITSSLMIIALTSLMVLGSGQPLTAGSLDDLNKRLQEIQKSQTKVTGELSIVQSKIKGTQENITELTNQIKESEVQIAAKETEYNEAVTKVNEAQGRVDAKQAEVNERQVIIRTRARATYEEGQTSTLGLLLQSKSFSDLLSRVEYLKCLDDKDKALLDDLQTHQKQLEEEKTNLTGEMEIAKTLKEETEQAKKDLEQKKKDLQASLVEFQKNEAELRESDKEMEEEAQKIQDDIKRIQDELKDSGQTFGTGSINTWPVPSSKTITSYFRTPSRPNHYGVDVGAPLGTTIVAAGDGTVIISYKCGHKNYCGTRLGDMGNYCGGYGNYVVVDHGNGVITKYGHLQGTYLPEIYSKVKAGQKIGEMGSTGRSSGSHLHFETRVNNVAKNPKDYFPSI